MPRLSLAALLAAFALVVVLPADGGAPEAAKLFPDAAVVKVFMYEATPPLDGGVMRDFKTLIPSAVPAAGVALSTAQADQIKQAFARPTGDQAIGACFVPRHGFVFEDAAGKVVGTLDVCFECSNYSIDAPGYKEKAKVIYDRYRQPDGEWDEKIVRKQTAEIDRLRAEYNMPPTETPIDWKGLAAVVEAANMPPTPKPADYERLRSVN